MWVIMKIVKWPFMAAGWALVAGAAVHVAALAGGARWLALLGAPPAVVASSVQGTWLAPVGTLIIAGVLIIFALYCLSAAGRFARLPAARPVLAVFAALLIARGLLALPFLLWDQHQWVTPIGRFVVNGPFFAVGSLIVLAIGASIATGIAFSIGHSRR